MTTLHSDPDTAPPFSTPKQLSKRWDVSTMTLRRWRSQGLLKAHHIGRGIRFAKSEVERFESESKA